MVSRACETERDPPPYTSGRSGDNGNGTFVFDGDNSAILM
jgi:hypothetical protein